MEQHGSNWIVISNYISDKLTKQKDNFSTNHNNTTSSTGSNNMYYQSFQKQIQKNKVIKTNVEF